MKLRGVNLGGWLLLERWITPSLFAGLQAKDEYSFCIETGTDKHRRLQQHRDSFITKDDFKWLAESGVNSLRLPIGYWALEDDEPFVNYRQHLDNAFRWASELNIGIVLDLHGAPGSQNVHDHCGRAGPIRWTEPENIERTLKVLEQLAKRYGEHEALQGISLLNEPGWEIPQDLLRDFYKTGYERVRARCDADVAVIISDAFRPLEWNGFMSGAEHSNVVLDMHLYQVFGHEYKVLDMEGHLRKVRDAWSQFIRDSDKPVIVGEWSLALSPKTYSGMDKQHKHRAIKSYADAQLEVFSRARGWYFWTYKTETASDWNFRHCLERGLLSF